MTKIGQIKLRYFRFDWKYIWEFCKKWFVVFILLSILSYSFYHVLAVYPLVEPYQFLRLLLLVGSILSTLIVAAVAVWKEDLISFLKERHPKLFVTVGEIDESNKTTTFHLAISNEGINSMNSTKFQIELIQLFKGGRKSPAKNFPLKNTCFKHNEEVYPGQELPFFQIIIKKMEDNHRAFLGRTSKGVFFCEENESTDSEAKEIFNFNFEKEGNLEDFIFFRVCFYFPNRRPLKRSFILVWDGEIVAESSIKMHVGAKFLPPIFK